MLSALTRVQRRIYELQLDVEVALGRNVTLRAPVTVLAWSPLLAPDVPATVPVALDAAARK